MNKQPTMDLSGVTKKKSSKDIQAVEDFFKPADEMEELRGFKVALQGKAKTGKTDIACSFPPPVFIVDLELGAQKVYNNRYKHTSNPPYTPVFPNEQLRPKGGKDIRIMECVVLNDRDDIDYDATIDKLFKALDSLKHVDRGTIVIDSATLFWKWLEHKWKKKKTGSDKAGSKFKFQFDWGPVTEEYHRLMMRLLAKPIHFIVIGHEKSIYDGKGKIIDGLYEGRWQNQTPHWVDFVLRTYKLINPNEAPDYEARVIESRYMRAMNDKIVDPSYMSIKKYMKTQFHVDIIDYPADHKKKEETE